MNLQAQYNKVALIATILTLMVAAFGFYFLLRYVLNKQLDDALRVEEAEIHDYIRKNNRLPDATVYKDQRIEFRRTEIPEKRHFKNIQTYKLNDVEFESSRQLIFNVTAGGQFYTAIVTISIESTQELIWVILIITIGLILLLGVIMYFSNRFLLKKLWRPFHHTLTSIKDFNLSAPGPIKMQDTHITEFNELNNNIRLMAGKVTKDYQSLKSFTDHASHEMQTPLAVIRSRLDTLIQQPELDEHSMFQIQQLYHAVDKLTRLSQSLLLLARIENNQFSSSDIVMLDEVVSEISNNLQELTASRELILTIHKQPLPVSMNSQLADILIGNLIRNAIRHTESGDNILIEFGANQISFSNSGSTGLEKEKVFGRFYKSERSEGSGLGLAIVKQICDQYGFRIVYSFSNKMHVFTIYLN
jgi:signal transduction histidine kinase